MKRWETPERKAYMKAWHAANPRDRRAYKAAYDAAHKERAAAYYAANKERLKVQKAAWYAANRERVLAQVQARVKANHAEVLAYHREHYIANKERVGAAMAAYRRANPDRYQHIGNRRRARKIGNGGSHTLAERLEKFARLGNVCFYCRCAARLTVDHDVPLTRGGTDDISNILPACRSCNSRKHSKTAAEFINQLTIQESAA